jgi:hypothetical protein
VAFQLNARGRVAARASFDDGGEGNPAALTRGEPGAAGAAPGSFARAVAF